MMLGFLPSPCSLVSTNSPRRAHAASAESPGDPRRLSPHREALPLPPPKGHEQAATGPHVTVVLPGQVPRDFLLAPPARKGSSDGGPL
jgi:hypothetical protein